MNNQDKTQTISKAKGRPMLSWVGKKPLDKIEYFPAQEKEVYGEKSSKEFNKLFWGDNLQVLSHLLKEYRGEIDLIYIDPPFDSKADYIKRVKIKGEKIEGGQQNILEEKQYTDIWENDEYLQFMYERLVIIKELLSDNGCIYLHCDWHKGAHLKLVMDEVFGEENYVNQIVWEKIKSVKAQTDGFGNVTDFIFLYRKSNEMVFNQIKLPHKESYIKQMYRYKDEDGRIYRLHDFTQEGRGKPRSFGENGLLTPPPGKHWIWSQEKIDKGLLENRIVFSKSGLPQVKRYLDEVGGEALSDLWNDVNPMGSVSSERGEYPTQKPEALLERIINASSNYGDLVMDCFCGSGTTLAVAQKLGRRWIGCDINIGAIQTSTKRLASIIEDQLGNGSVKSIKDEFRGLHAFKILNVNDYDIFKNEIEAKEIVMDMYGVEPIKRSSFDGILDSNFVKVMPLNRVLNKLDIKNVLKDINDNIDSFTAKSTSKSGEEVYQEGVTLICSGAELDTDDYIKKENNTGVKVNVKDILNDKKNLIFKKKPEAKIEVKAKNSELSVVIKEFYSPILMRKLELENEKMIDKKAQAKVEDFKQVIESVAIDADYDSKLFNAEIIDLPDKKEVIKAQYKYHYPKKGKYTVAIKIVDVLGEEYFETFNVEV